MDDEWIEIGTIVSPHALDGEVRVYSNSDFPQRFLEPGMRWLKCPEDSEPQPIELLSGRYIPSKGLYVLKLAGIDDRARSEVLRDAKLLVPASDRLPLEADEYHVRDLLNLEVFNQINGEAIGTVIDIIPAGNDLLEVRLHKQPEPLLEKADAPIPNRPSKIRKKPQRSIKTATVLIPFVKEIVPIVDLENRRIEIAPPTGLI